MKKATQRPTAADRQAQQARADRRARALERLAEKAEYGQSVEQFIAGGYQ